VLPTTQSTTRAITELKLQDPTLVKKWARCGERFPARGMGSTVLQLTEAAERRGRKAKRATMLAWPVLLRHVAPVGAQEMSSLPKLTVKSNLVTMDENADVTFGSTQYPAAVRA